MNRYATIIAVVLCLATLPMPFIVHAQSASPTPTPIIRTAYPVTWPSPQPSIALGQSGPQGVLLYELQHKLGVTATTTDKGLLVDPLPSGVTQAQVQSAINAWSPSDTIPPTPQQSALNQLQSLYTQAGSWSNLTTTQKDTAMKLMLQIHLNQQVQ